MSIASLAYARCFTFVKTTPPAAATKTIRTAFSALGRLGTHSMWRADRLTPRYTHWDLSSTVESFSLPKRLYLDTLKILEQYLMHYYTSRAYLFIYLHKKHADYH